MMQVGNALRTLPVSVDRGDGMSQQPEEGTPVNDGDASAEGAPHRPVDHPWQSPGASTSGAAHGQPHFPARQYAPHNPYAPPHSTAPDGPGTPAFTPVNPWAQGGPGPAHSGTPTTPGAPPLPYPQPPRGGQGYPPPPMYQAPPKPGIIPLRPLGLGEILDGAFQACRRNPLATFGIAILLQAVVALVTVLMIGNLFSSLEVLESENPTSDSIIGAVASFGAFASVATVVSAAALLILQGILVIPIARAIINQRTSFGQAWRLGRRRILPLICFGLLVFALGLVGFALLVGISALAILGLNEFSALVIVPLVLLAVAALTWVSIKLVVAPAALMLEGTGPWTSMRRSWALTRGNWWRTFGIVLLTSIIVSIIASVISLPLSFAVSLFFGFSSSASSTPDALDSIPILLATQAITALFTAIGYAFQAGVTALLYVDLRIRREGFDVVLMREHELAGKGRTDILPGGTSSFGHQPGGRG